MITSLGHICIDMNHMNWKSSVDSQLVGCLSCKIEPERQKQGRMPEANWTARRAPLPSKVPGPPTPGHPGIALKNGRNPSNQTLVTAFLHFPSFAIGLVCRFSIAHSFSPESMSHTERQRRPIFDSTQNC